MKQQWRTLKVSGFAMIAAFLLSCSGEKDLNWAYYLADLESSHFVEAIQITRENVANLEVAWTYHGGEADPDNRSQIQCNPLVIDGVLYGSTATLKFIALDASTGQLIWSFDPFDEAFGLFGMGVNRGLMYWENHDQSDRRLYFAAGSSLYCLNAENGTLQSSFGDAGKVDLKQG